MISELLIHGVLKLKLNTELMKLHSYKFFYWVKSMQKKKWIQFLL